MPTETRYTNLRLSMLPEDMDKIKALQQALEATLSVKLSITSVIRYLVNKELTSASKQSI